MNKAATQYRRAVKKNLRCTLKVKIRLMDGFDHTLSGYLEENQNPTADDLVNAFGPPKEMADVLISNLSQSERTQYRKTTLLGKILLATLVVLFLALTAYIWSFKTKGLTAIDEASKLSITEETNAQHHSESAGGNIEHE